MEQKQFIEAVEKIRSLAAQNNNTISAPKVKELLILDEIKLNDDQLRMVYAYLKTSGIKLADEADYDDFDSSLKPDEDNASKTCDEGESTTFENVSSESEGLLQDAGNDMEEEFLKMYEEDLRQITVLDDTQVLSAMQELSQLKSDGNLVKELNDKLVNTYLNKVIAWLKDYTDTAVLMSDLIQEGNMALMQTVRTFDYKAALQAANPVRKLKDTIKKNVLKAAQECIYMQESESNVGYKIEGRVNAVNECAKKLSGEYAGKVTIAQVAEEMKMSEEEISQIVKLSGYKIESIADE